MNLNQPSQPAQLNTTPSFVERLRGSVPLSWVDFNSRYFGLFVRIGVSRGLDLHTAQDVAQDTMVVAYRRITHNRFAFRGPGSLRAWASRIASHLTIDKFRKGARKRSVKLIPFSHFESDRDAAATPFVERVAAPVAENEDFSRPELLSEALEIVSSKADPRDLLIFQLVKGAGKSHKEVGSMLHPPITEENCRIRLYRILPKIKAAYASLAALDSA